MEKQEKINLEFTNEEYIYLLDFLNANYNTFKRLPKKFRTEKFNIMENLVHNQFLLVNENTKLKLD